MTFSSRARDQRSASTGSRRGLALWFIFACALLCRASTAWAGNDDGILLGNDAALVGGAVVSTVSDGSALWYNPAGLALSSKDSVDVSASAFVLRHYNMPGLLSADGGSGGNASFTELVSVPSAVTYVRRFNPRLIGALGLFASEVGDVILRSSLAIPINQVDVNVKFLITDQIARYHLALGLAGRLGRRVTFGAAAFGDYDSESGLTQVAATDSVGSTPFGSAVSSAFEQDKVLGAHLRVGMTYQPLANVRIGGSLQSAGAYFYRSTRSTTIDSTTAPNADATQLDLSAASSEQSASKFAVGRYSPWRARLGGSVLLASGVTLSIEGDVQTKLDNHVVDIERRFTWNLRAGARIALSENLSLGGGLFTDRSPARTDELGAGRVDFYGGTLGGQYQTVRWLARDASASAAPTGAKPGVTFASTVAVRYAYGSGKLTGQRLTAPSFDPQGNAVEVAVHEVTVHLGSGVSF